MCVRLRASGTLSVALGQVADVVLVKVLVEGGSQQLLGQVGQDGSGSAAAKVKGQRSGLFATM